MRPDPTASLFQLATELLAVQLARLLGINIGVAATGLDQDWGGLSK